MNAYESKMQAWRKVMAAYRRGWLIVTCGLTACTPGSAPGPTLGDEYERILLFTYCWHEATVILSPAKR